MTAFVVPEAYAFKTGTISSSVVAMADIGGVGSGFSQDELNEADQARVSCATESIRYRYDGGDPSATVGHLIAANGEVIIQGANNIARLKFIRTGSDGVVSITLEQL